MKKIAVVAAVCSLATTASAHPRGHGDFPTPTPKAVPSMADMMKPAAEMERLKSMIGTWKCEGTSADPGKPTMRSVRSTMKTTRELGGHWLMVDYVEEKTKENPVPLSFKQAIGWDKASGKYHRMFIDNMGGTAMTMAALPAADGRMEWNGEAKMGERTMPMRDVATMRSDKETLIVVTMQGSDGTWMPVANLTCRK